MVKRKEMKIHVEQLMEDAWNWFKDLPEAKAENIIVDAYMEAKEISKNDVEW